MGKKDWRTPMEFFQERNKLFNFTVDAASDDENYLVERHYTVDTDGLNPDHYVAGDRVWCNPTHDASLIRWLALASETRRRGVFWELLLPPSTETRWWHTYVWDKRLCRSREGVEVEFLEGRIAFIDPEHPERQSPRSGNVLVRFWPEVQSC